MLEIETVLEQIAVKRSELQVTRQSDKRYDILLTELNSLLILKGKLI